MREILFRGKEKSTGKWFEGSYVYAHKFYGTGEAGHKIYNIYGDDKVLIDPTTLGQFTGLTDKNGKKIFEGDIVKFTDITSYPYYDETFENIGVVQYAGNHFYITNRNAVDMEDLVDERDNTMNCEVIGNIHDNPELLEGNDG